MNARKINDLFAIKLEITENTTFAQKIYFRCEGLIIRFFGSKALKFLIIVIRFFDTFNCMTSSGREFAISINKSTESSLIFLMYGSSITFSLGQSLIKVMSNRLLALPIK